MLTLHGGVGLQEAQYRGLWIFLDPPPGDVNGYHAAEVERELLMQGFVGAELRVHSRLTLIGDVQSIPLFRPDIDLLELSVDRSYMSFLGVRYLLADAIRLDASLRYHTGVEGIRSTQVVIALNALLSLR